MRHIIIAVLFSFIYYGCTESSNPLNPVPDTKPAWPMFGYNARNTSSPYALNSIMNPVINGALDWSYTFPQGNLSDGSQFCVDSRGYVYFIHQIQPPGAIYKFSPDGHVVWKRDSLIQWNFAAISLSMDESRIYTVVFKPGSYDRLYCLDSSGAEMWFINNAQLCKPAIGKDGTIYTFLSNGLTAVSSNGGILWTNESLKGPYNHNYIAIDKAGNLQTFIYNGMENYSVVKTDKNGTVLWQKATGLPFFGMVIDGYGNSYYVDASVDKLICLGQNGNTKWSVPNVYGYFTPVINSKNDVIYYKNSFIISCDTAGNEKWRCQAFTNQGAAEGLLLDDFDNVYYIQDASYIKAGSVSSNGVKRWEIQTDMGSTLPPPSLMPNGKMLIAPKRAYKIQAVN